MYSKEGHAGINLTTEKIQLVEIINQDNGFFLTNVDEEYFSESVDLNEKETKLSSILQAAFNELLLRTPLTAANVSFTLSPEYFKIVELPFEKSLIKSDFENHLQWEFEQLFPYLKLDDVILQHIELTPENPGNTNRMLFVAAIKKHLKFIYKFCSRNNFNLKFVDNSHFAANSILRLNPNIPPDETGMSVYLIDNFFSVLIFHDHLPSFYKKFKYERIDQMFEIISSYLNELSDTGFNKEKIKFAFLMGERASESFREKFAEMFSIKCSLTNPFDFIPLSEKLNENNFIKTKYNSFAASAGIALRQI